MAEFDNILISILSKDKPTRQHGEHQLESFIKSNTEQVWYCFISAMSSSDQEISRLAAILTRKYFMDEENVKNFPETSQAQIKASLFALVSSQKSLSFLKLLADILVGFADLLKWAHELMGYMAQ